MPIPTMNCPSCNTEVTANAKFCPECGAKMVVSQSPEFIPGFYPKNGEHSRLAFYGSASFSANSQSNTIRVSYRKLQNVGNAPTGPLEYRIWFATAPYSGTGNVCGIEMGRMMETCSLQAGAYLEDRSFSCPIVGNPITGDYTTVLAVHEYNMDGTAPVVAWMNFEKGSHWQHIPGCYLAQRKDGWKQMGEHVKIALEGDIKCSWNGSSGFDFSATISNTSEWDSGALWLTLQFVDIQSGKSFEVAGLKIINDTLPRNASSVTSGTLTKTISRIPSGQWSSYLYVSERNAQGDYDIVGLHVFPGFTEW